MSDSSFRQLTSLNEDVRIDALHNILSDHDEQLGVLATQVKWLEEAVKQLGKLARQAEAKNS